MEKKRNYESPISESIEMEGNCNIMEGSKPTPGPGGTDPGDDEPGSGNEIAPTDIWDTNK